MIYSVNGAGKIGHLHAKELNWIIISHHVYRLLSKFIGLDFIVLCRYIYIYIYFIQLKACDSPP